MATEFGGDDGPAGIPKKPKERLTPAEKLRLGYTTGTDDPLAKPNKRAWHGQKNEVDPEIQRLLDNQ